MTEHLLECPVIALLIKGNTVAAGSCICARLRACEERMRDQLREMGQVWCNAHGSHVSRNDVHLMLDKLRKP